MANCKFCGQSVRTSSVFHSACWESRAHRVAEEFCDHFCRFPRECADEEQLEQDHCDSCPLIRLLNLGL